MSDVNDYSDPGAVIKGSEEKLCVSCRGRWGIGPSVLLAFGDYIKNRAEIE